MSLPRPDRNTVALFAVCLGSLMFGLEISSVPVILPTLEKSLHGSFKAMQWIMNAYTIACTTVLMASGTLADRYGRKRVLMLSLAGFGVTSLLCGLAWNAPVLIVGRFLQGLAGGAMLICLLAVLSHQFRDGHARSKAFGLWGIVFGIGLGFGPLIGGAIVALSDWSWVFLVHVPLTMLTLLLVSAGVGESSDPDAKRLDLAGILTLSFAVLGVTYYITQGPELGFASVAALAVLLVAALSFAAFLIAEKRSAHPMFDFSVFRIGRFSGAIVGSVGMNFSFWPFMIYLPIYFQGALDYDAVTAGSALLAYTLPTLFVPPLAERLSLRYQPGVVIPAGLFTIGLGFLLMKLGGAAHAASWLTLLPGCVIAGLGLGLTNTPVSNTTTGSVPSARSGMASGIDMSARLITLAVNIALMGFILTQGILAQLRRALPEVSDLHALRALAENIASGDAALLQSAATGLAGIPPATVRAALVHGFDGVMLYGGLGVWALAAISLVVFRSARRPRDAAAEPLCETG
jgi:EmrB/QacA subfamily drug resistance transporter